MSAAVASVGTNDVIAMLHVPASAAGSLLHVVGVVGRSHCWVPLRLSIVFSTSTYVHSQFSDYIV